MANIEKRTGKNGDASYRVLIRLKGHPSESATFKRLTDAKLWAQSTETAIRERRYFKSAESKKHTVADLIDRYLEKLKKSRPKRYKDVESKLKWWKEELGYCVLSDLNRALITEKLDRLSHRKHKREGELKEIAPATINRYISALSHACQIAVKDWEWLDDNPFRKISKNKEPRGRVRFLSNEERERFLQACKNSRNPVLYPIVVLALSTGARRGEITKMEWSQVDLERGVIILHETKNEERRALPITGHALQILKKMHMDRNAGKVRRIDTDLVFPSPQGDRPYYIRSAWDYALKQAKIENFRFHDLRHSAASYLAMNGASLAEIAEVLGHKTLQMVKRYAHLSEAHTSSVVASMNERIFGDANKTK